MNKIILESSKYEFNALSRTITFTENQLFEYVLLITNITDNVIIYNFGCQGQGGGYAGQVLTLDYDTTLMSNNDSLQIILYTETSSDELAISNIALRSYKQEILLANLVELQMETNKLLKKIYNPE